MKAGSTTSAGSHDRPLSAPALLRRVVSLGSGEFLARALSVANVVLLGHLYGVVALGVYSLAASMSQYLAPLIDFGLRHVGARLIARFPRSASEIVQRVQRRRLLMAAAVLPFILLYAALARLPFPMKVFLFVFTAFGALYVFSLEWAAWGREHLLLVGLAKAIVPACLLLGVLTSLAVGHLFVWLAVANLVGFVVQGFVFWNWWRRHRSEIGAQEKGVAEIAHALQWRSTSIMGLAWLGNMAFNTSDMLVLGVFSNPHQVGLYSAAYRILNQVLVTYYLLTNVLYPQLARLDVAERRRMLRLRIFLLLFVSGAALALFVGLVRRPALSIVFGRDFAAAAPLLLLLACCIPLDFLTSYLSNAYLAWNMERRVLVCAAVAAGSNIALNLASIPRYGAMAAAVNTVIAYLVYLVALSLAGRTAWRT